MKRDNVMQVVFRMIKALIIAGLVTVLFLLLISTWMYRADPGEKVLSAALILTYIAAGFLGGLYMGHKMDRRKFLWGMGTGLFYFLVLTMLALSLPDGGLQDTKRWLLAGALCVGGGCIGGMIG